MKGRLFSLTCPFRAQGCSRRFKNQNGRTKHVRTFHTNHNIVEPEDSDSAPVYDDNPRTNSWSPEPQNAPNTPPEAPSTREPSLNHDRQRNYHPYLTGLPCDAMGNFLDPGTPPMPRDDPTPDDWTPFDDESQFCVADFLFRKEEMSAGNIDILMDIWALSMAKHDDLGPFSSYQHMYSTIDSINDGNAPWKSFMVSYGGELNENSPSWMLDEYEVWYRDPLVVIGNMLDNSDFNGHYSYAPFIEVDSETGERRWNEFMSANYSWRKATEIYENDNSTKDSMYCPIILGADKTTVSVATGHVEYHPLYMSPGGVHNTVRHAHRNAVSPIAFLAIPKSDRKYDNDASFRKFKCQIYHASISAILKTLRKGMTEPVILRCPDGHYRRVIFDLAAFIADYPEQVALAGIVQGWCPKCTALPNDLDGKRGRRTRAFTDELIEILDSKLLWDEYGIDDDILPFTHDFPRADIYEMLTPDLLHQLIKGTFKDHLVTWVGEYLSLEHGDARANEIMDDINRRIAAAPLFPNLHHFPHGRRFKQWTGDDSKALMKVYISAIAGHVPSEMVQAISSFLDVCYLVRRADITETTLRQFNAALEKFYAHQEVFRNVGVRPTGFSLPRQHSLSHYHFNIEEFGAPGGICSSITESRHITAVKKPWRRSSRYQALGQMLLTNQRLDKLAALRVDYVRRGMLMPSYLPLTKPARQTADNPDLDMVMGNVVLARTPVRSYPSALDALARHISCPSLPELTRRFLFDQLNNNKDVTSDNIPLHLCPEITSSISVFHSAVASYFSPGDESGIRGICREWIRSCPMWRKKGPRRDTAFVIEDEDKPGMKGMSIVRIHLFFSFYHAGHYYPCVLVEWFNTYGRSCDPVTGMWRVRPDIRNGKRFCTVIHLDSLLRGAHLLPTFGTAFLPINFDYKDSLDAFSGYYVNHFVDHHAHEIVF
ncbi:hypothetical protein BYT27DRAFT_7278824 [Phlegmacium glaucopus]|nr:hypothetical protein BYT27DRAFT_7278824 [Phlegmacium glaucopus]